MNFDRPPRLRPGSRVALVAPAGPVTEERIALSIERCELLGLQPVLGAAARKQFGYLAGADAERAADLQRAFDAEDIDAVWALRGGYGTTRILPRLDFTKLRGRRKAYIGFSDNTAVHLALFGAGMVSFHGPHPGAEFPDETRAAFERVLFENSAAGDLPLRASDPAPRRLRGGSARGPLVGGNLSMLAATCGTNTCVQARGCILFIEDVNEPAYRIDRALTQLHAAGALNGIVGFAFGRFTDVEIADRDRPVDDVLTEFAERLNVPAVVDFPIGHIEHNWTIPVGVNAELNADEARLTILESAVE